MSYWIVKFLLEIIENVIKGNVKIVFKRLSKLSIGSRIYVSFVSVLIVFEAETAFSVLLGQITVILVTIISI